MNLNAMLKECTKPHALLHSLAGVGLGLVLVGLIPDLSANALMLGLLALVLGIVGEFVWVKK